MNPRFVSFALLAFVAHPAAAATPPGIDALVAAQGSQYLALREQVLTSPDFSAWASQQPARDWRQSVLVEALFLRAHQPDIDAPLARLRGVDPQAYLKARRPEPMVGRELLALRVPGAILIERYWKTFDRHALHRSAYPEQLSANEIEQLRAKERTAMATALLWAVGSSGHGAAAPFLAMVAADTNTDPTLRGVAARSLGDTGAPRAADDLRALLQSDEAQVISGAVAGAAKLRNEAGLQLLELALSTATTRGVRQQALLGLGSYANANTWGGSTEPNLEHRAHLREAAAMRLVDAAKAPWALEVRDALVQALAATGHASAAAALQALAARGSATERDIANEALQLLAIEAQRGG